MSIINWLFLRFLGAGSISTAVTYLIYLFIVDSFGPGASYLICYFIGMALNFFLHSKYVFFSSISAKRIFLYIFSHLFLSVVGALMLEAIIVSFSLAETVAPIFVVLVMTPLSFFFLRIALR